MSQERSGTASDGEHPEPPPPRRAGGTHRPAARDAGIPAAAVSTYRYLRLAIVTAVVTLAVSLGLERAHATCWNDSVSAYYYTPVHSVFVAALGVTGVALLAIRGATQSEEALLNGAAFLAPVVAFIPTGWSDANCPSNLTGSSKKAVEALLDGNRFFAMFSGNNLVAFVAGGFFAIVVATAVARYRGRENLRTLRKEVVLPAVGSVAVVVTGFIWHEEWPAAFNRHAHSYAAALMFLLIGVVILLTAVRDRSSYRLVYFACVGTMAVGAVACSFAGLAVRWQHEILIIEAIEISGFVAFWFAQTIQLWHAGPPQPDVPVSGAPP